MYDLAHNFLNLERYPQAKKLFETPGLRYHEDKIGFIAKQLIEDGKVEPVENLVVLTRELFGCNRDVLYSFLFKVYQRDCPEKVADMWVMMQEENFVPSETMKIKMAATLRSAGVEVPFNVTERRRPKEKESSTTGETESS